MQIASAQTESEEDTERIALYCGHDRHKKINIFSSDFLCKLGLSLVTDIKVSEFEGNFVNCC